MDTVSHSVSCVLCNREVVWTVCLKVCAVYCVTGRLCGQRVSKCVLCTV